MNIEENRIEVNGNVLVAVPSDDERVCNAKNLAPCYFLEREDPCPAQEFRLDCAAVNRVDKTDIVWIKEQS